MAEGQLKRHSVPVLRGLDRELRAKRLLAARSYRPHSIPRFAILLGHWDAGSIVSAAARGLKKKRKRRVKK